MTDLRWPTVLFDFDGTLADTIPLILASYRHTLDQVGGQDIDEAEIRSWIGSPLREAFEERWPGRGDDIVEIYRTWNLANHDDLIEAVPGVPELLADLASAGARLGVVSSKRKDTVELGLRAVGIEDQIGVLAGMLETQRHKPYADPLLFAAAALGVEPSSCVYVGDATVDLLAARDAGMSAVAVTWGAGERAALEALAPEAIVDSVAALRAALLGGTAQ